MDGSKLKVLRELPYRVLPTCGLCRHSSFGRMGQWGTCGVHTYEHGKHTGNARQLSINVHGTCPSFQASEESVCLLEGFSEFFG